jgi:hypothetical protein
MLRSQKSIFDFPKCWWVFKLVIAHRIFAYSASAGLRSLSLHSARLNANFSQLYCNYWWVSRPDHDRDAYRWRAIGRHLQLRWGQGIIIKTAYQWSSGNAKVINGDVNYFGGFLSESVANGRDANCTFTNSAVTTKAKSVIYSTLLPRSRLCRSRYSGWDTSEMFQASVSSGACWPRRGWVDI